MFSADHSWRRRTRAVDCIAAQSIATHACRRLCGSGLRQVARLAISPDEGFLVVRKGLRAPSGVVQGSNTEENPSSTPVVWAAQLAGIWGFAARLEGTRRLSHSPLGYNAACYRFESFATLHRYYTVSNVLFSFIALLLVFFGAAETWHLMFAGKVQVFLFT